MRKPPHQPVIGIALFEVFHDIQYLTIVWAFNSRLGDKGEGDGGFSQRLFQRAWKWIGLYVLLVAAYGAVGFFVPKLIANGSLHRTINGALIAAASNVGR